MKKLLLLLLLFPALCFSQDNERPLEPFFGVQWSTTRVGPTAGMLYERVELSLSYDYPGLNQIRREILSLTAGYVLVNKNVSLTAFSGVAQVYGRFDKHQYEKNDLSVIIPEHKAFIGGVELGYSSNAGKVFVTGRYCEKAFITFGFKVFPRDL